MLLRLFLNGFLVRCLRSLAAGGLAAIVVVDQRLLRKLVTDAAQLEEALCGIVSERASQCNRVGYFFGGLVVLTAVIFLAAFNMVHVNLPVT
jgi:hypothetical protein